MKNTGNKMAQLLRIDDRLIHGQVVVGWANALHPKDIILIDDEIAEDQMEKEIYLLGVPIEYNGVVYSVEEASIKLKESADFIAVCKSPCEALKLFKSGFHFQELNLGGMHDKNETKMINHYIYLSETDIKNLDTLKNNGVEIFIQDLPNSKKIIY
ncbi:MAG: PTS sugar transporter subunit IIB [Candidatus Delongbacteria bacterium]|nr:PTS sugar transporter subunit IIB [Candidatus Delongbacteria bacterium]